MRNRYRRMYQLTGLPGWMRFGYSPGWAGQNPTGLGPAAQYLIHGTWPTQEMNYAWQQGRIPFAPAPGFPQPGFPTPFDPWGAVELTPEEEIYFLKAEAEQLEDELSALEKKIQELEGEKK